MTTFTDREQALEAHFAALELAVFRELEDAGCRIHLEMRDHLGILAEQSGRESLAHAVDESQGVFQITCGLYHQDGTKALMLHHLKRGIITANNRRRMPRAFETGA